ncbi:MAG: hypothetical protein WC813_01445 [Patescibacteria group bacterium]|jgi:hypothetical protein
MLGIILNLPPAVTGYLAVTPPEVMAAQALLVFGWIPIFAVIVWGMTHVWVDYKQEQYAHHQEYVLMEVTVPQTAIQTPKGMDNFFSNLAGTRSSITWREHWLLGKEQAVFSFEIASHEGSIHFYIRCTEKLRDLVEADLYAQYPEAQITEVEDYVHNIPTKYPDNEWEAFGAEFVLSKPQYFPIRTYEDFEHQGEKDFKFKDPLFPILELMGKMRAGENFWIQIVLRMPHDQDWTKPGLEFVNKIMGKEEKHKTTMMQELGGMVSGIPKEVARQLFVGGEAGGAEKKPAKSDFQMFKLTPADKTQIEGVTDKISKVGWQSKIRVVYSGKKTNFRKGMMAAGMKGMMLTYANSVLNQFGMHGPSIPKDDYFWMAWQYAGKQSKLTSRYAKRSLGPGATPCILNSEELATLWHFPGADSRTPVLTAQGSRRAEAPGGLPMAPVGEPEMVDWKKMQGNKPSAPTDEEIERAFSLPTPHSPSAPEDEAPSNLPV